MSHFEVRSLLSYRLFRAFLLSFSLLAQALAGNTVQAQMNIEIKGVGQSLFPVAVMRFVDENKLPTSVSEIIRQDLTSSGYFKNTESGNNSEAIDSPNYKTWAARGADALVVGQVNVKSANEFEINYRLYDIRKGQGLGGLTLNASANNVRHCNTIKGSQGLTLLHASALAQTGPGALACKSLIPMRNY